jgi:hypothetical protein
MASHVHRSRSDYYRMDMGKNTLHMIGLDKRGAIMLRKKVSRGRITSRLANLPPCLIGIEAGLATHYVARELAALGHKLKQSARKHILAWPAKTVLTAHGTAVEKDARAYLSRAFG